MLHLNHYHAAINLGFFQIQRLLTVEHGTSGYLPVQTLPQTHSSFELTGYLLYKNFSSPFSAYLSVKFYLIPV